MQKMIIANRLTDGLVVFLTDENSWSASIEEGVVLDDEAAEEEHFRIAKRHEQQCLVIDPNLIEVTVDDGRPKPTAIREAIRAFGPTV